MKKTTKFLLMVLLLIIIVGCTNKKVKDPEKIKIGVIGTTQLKYKSSIHWYDENLEVIDVQKLRYADLGGTFSRPIYDKDEVFIIPQGLQGKADSKKVISLNIKDFTVEEFNVLNLGLNNLAVTDKYIFTTNRLNAQAHISRVDRITKEFTEKVIDVAYFPAIIAFKDKVLLFGNMVDNELETFIYVLDEDFNILETVDLSDVGVGGWKYLIDNNDLYISIPSNTTETLSNNKLIKINMDSYVYEVIELDNEEPDTIIKYQGKLFIAHNNISTGYGSILTVMDISTKDQTVYDLQRDLDYVEVVGDNLVVLDQEKISLFDIKNEFKLIKEVMIDLDKAHYVSMMIVID